MHSPTTWPAAAGARGDLQGRCWSRARGPERRPHPIPHHTGCRPHMRRGLLPKKRTCASGSACSGSMPAASHIHRRHSFSCARRRVVRNISATFFTYRACRTRVCARQTYAAGGGRERAAVGAGLPAELASKGASTQLLKTVRHVHPRFACKSKRAGQEARAAGRCLSYGRNLGNAHRPRCRRRCCPAPPLPQK